MRTKFISLLYKTNRFRVAVHLSSNRSQRTTKCGKNNSDILGYRLVCHFLTWKIFIFFKLKSCSGGPISLHHSFTPSLLVRHLETGGSSQYEKAWNARGKI